MRIYLDHNAGTPLRPEAAAAIAPMLQEHRGNPASVHRSGQAARRMLERAREQVASAIGAAPREVVFTGGGTESNNLAIFGSAGATPRRRKIVSSEMEHSSTLAPLEELQRRGFELVKLAPDADGRIDPAKVIAAIDGDTALVTLGLANSEVGAILDVAPIAAAARASGVTFHLDAVQAVGRIACDVASLGCDLMTVSGHKLGAPAGIGGLYVRDAARLVPQMLGGPHENGLRAGTPNLLGAVAFGAAAEASFALTPSEAIRIGTLASSLYARLRDAIPGLRLNGTVIEDFSRRLPNTLNLTFPGVLGESMLIALDLEGVEVSMGSACAAGSVEPSHVLRAMGRSAADARSSLRISLGWNTTAAEIDAAAGIIARVWQRVAAAEPLAQGAES